VSPVASRIRRKSARGVWIDRGVALSTFSVGRKSFVTLQASTRSPLTGGRVCRVAHRKQDEMAIFIALGSYVEQGFHQMGKTISRTEDFKLLAVQYGMAVKDIFWMQGQQYDMAAILEGPSCKTAQALLLVVNMRGNIRTQLFRAHSAEEIEAFSVKSAADAPEPALGAIF
jgi:uncharacterized protein with GYD domain